MRLALIEEIVNHLVVLMEIVVSNLKILLNQDEHVLRHF